MRDKIISEMEKRGDLPVLPEILVKLQILLKNPDTGLMDVAKLIETEPALSGKILKMSNSPYYRTGYQKIDSLTTAVSKLGLDKIKQLVFSLSITGLFSNIEAINVSQFWKHGLAVANFTNHLAEYTGISKKVQDVAYLSGLMHDVGVMVFCHVLPDYYPFFLETVHKEEVPLEKQEKETFEIDHQELGALFIKKWWNMDEQIVQSVMYHHLPFDGTQKEKQYQQLVHIANGLCTTFGQPNGINCYNPVFNQGAWEGLGLSLENIEKMMTEVEKSVAQASELLSF
jgi:HD-like signal output (HDOD) protein